MPAEQNKSPIASVGKIGGTTNWRYKGKYYTAEIPPFNWEWYEEFGGKMKENADKMVGVFALAYLYYKAIVNFLNISYDKPSAYKFVKGIRKGFVESGGYWTYPPLPAVNFIEGLDFGRYRLSSFLYIEIKSDNMRYTFTGHSLVEQCDEYEVTFSYFDMPAAYYDGENWTLGEVREPQKVVKSGKIVRNQPFEVVFDYIIVSSRVGLLLCSVIHYRNGQILKKYSAGRVLIVSGGFQQISFGEQGISSGDIPLAFLQVW